MVREMKRRVLNLLIALDQLLWVIITLGAGSPDETISSAAYRGWLKDHPVAIVAKPVLDFLFLPFEANHCRESYTAELQNHHLPEHFRD